MFGINKHVDCICLKLWYIRFLVYVSNCTLHKNIKFIHPSLSLGEHMWRLWAQYFNIFGLEDTNELLILKLFLIMIIAIGGDILFIQNCTVCIEINNNRICEYVNFAKPSSALLFFFFFLLHAVYVSRKQVLSVKRMQYNDMTVYYCKLHNVHSMPNWYLR